MTVRNLASVRPLSFRAGLRFAAVLRFAFYGGLLFARFAAVQTVRMKSFECARRKWAVLLPAGVRRIPRA